MPLRNQTIGFIGAGNMAEALIRSLIDSGVCSPAAILASDISSERGNYLKERYNINFLANNKELAEKADVIMYAVKPYMLQQVLSEVSPVARNNQIHISIAAGISIDFIKSILPAGASIVRVMPNTPALVGAGAAAYALSENISPEAEMAVKEIFDCTGVSVKVAENLLDAVTGLSGSGPAYGFLIIEAMADAGVKVGLPRDVSLLLAAQTMLGAAKMVLETGEHPAKLKDMVTTPGGTTIAALHVLETGKIRGTLMDAVAASKSRAAELGAGK